MAEFNPRVQPINDPSYLGLSKPISQPDADKTLGTLFSGMGTLLDSGVKGLNTLVEESIKKEAYAGIDPKTGKAISSLEAVLSGQRPGGRALGYDAAGGEAGGGGALPYDVAEAGSTTGELAGAREGGKLRKTYYEGSVNEFTKGLRARYPGYREEVDKAVDRAVMGGRANEFMDKLIADINDSGIDTRRTRDKLQAEVLKSDAYPYQPWLLKQIEEGKITTMSEVVKHTGPYVREKVDLELRKARRDDRTGTRTFDKDTELQELDAALPVSVANRVKSVITMAGLTPEKVMDALTRTQRGEADPASEEVVRKFGMAVAADMEKMKRQWYDDASVGGRRSTIAIVGIDEYNKRVDAHAKPMEDMVKHIFNKDYGEAYRTANMITATQNTATMNIYRSKPLGAMMATAEAFRKMTGEHGPLSNQFQRDVLGKVESNLRPFIEDQVKRISVQENLDKSGVPVTFKDITEESLKAGVKPPEAYDAYVRYVDRVTEPKVSPEEKRNILLGAFHPNNQGMVSLWPKSVKDGKGNTVSPQLAVFKGFTSQAIADEVQKVDRAFPEAEVAKHYKNWTINETNKLFSEELNNLGTFTRDKGIIWNWDDKNNRLFYELTPEVRAAEARRGAAGIQAGRVLLDQSLNRINNTLIPSLKTMAEATGNHVPSTILGAVLQHGRTAPDQPITGVSREIAEAFLEKRRQELLEKEKAKARKERFGVE